MRANRSKRSSERDPLLDATAPRRIDAPTRGVGAARVRKPCFASATAPSVPSVILLALAVILAPLELAACSSANPAAAEAFDAARAWKDLENLVALGPRPVGSPALERTRAYIEAELARAGLRPQRDSFRVDPPAGFTGARPSGGVFELANVYADLEPPGASNGEMVLLCTHFDTKLSRERFVGANDGGSGTAVLLELARVLARSGPRGVAYRFLFLDGEEALNWNWKDPDNCYGSRHHAAALKQNGAAARVRACVLLDMVGDKDLGLLRESYSDQRLTEIFFAAARAAGLGAHVDARREEIRDDHISFMDVGIPSVDLIDFDYGPRNAHWHAASDTLENCAAASLEITGRIVLAGLPSLERDFRRR
jgi:glutaminyl-peptide cyclotransferase